MTDDKLKTCLIEWERQNDELRAENERLRKALHAIIDDNKIVFGDWPEYFSTRIAREALGKLRSPV